MMKELVGKQGWSGSQVEDTGEVVEKTKISMPRAPPRPWHLALLKLVHQGWLLDASGKTLGEELLGRALGRTRAWLLDLSVVSSLEHALGPHRGEISSTLAMDLAKVTLDIAVKFEMVAGSREEQVALEKFQACVFGRAPKQVTLRMSMFFLRCLCTCNLKKLR